MASQLPLGAVRTETGEVIVPASRRADGSVRKPIRIRQGYVPQDEVPKYKTVAQRRREQEAQQQAAAATAAATDRAATASSPPLRQQQQRVPSSDADALSLESLTLESKAAATQQSAKTAAAAATQQSAKTAAAAATTTTAGASPRPSTGAQARRTDDAGRTSHSELKHELSKLNRLLKDIEKLEARAQESELPPPLQRKVARKTEVQTRRSAIIAELNGAAMASTRASSSLSPSPPSRAASAQPKKKKTFVAIEL